MVGPAKAAVRGEVGVAWDKRGLVLDTETPQSRPQGRRQDTQGKKDCRCVCVCVSVCTCKRISKHI